MIFQSLAEYRASSHVPRVCIIGSGPAGLTVARKLAAHGVPSLVLEAGGEDYSDEAQDVYRGKTVGDHYFDLDITRLRHFGGSSNHWAGWCRLLDAHDFLPRPHIPHSGWPITRADIEPFLADVRDILGIPDWAPETPLSEQLRQVEMIKSDPVRFREKFGPEIAASASIALVLNTYVTELEGDGAQVTGALAVSAGAPSEKVTAEHYVVATGGLENSRLLLWSNQRSNGAVVPNAAALGRYWMEHNHYQVGHALLFDDSAFAWDASNEAFVSVTAAAMEAHAIGNFAFRIVPMPYQGAKRLVASLACVAPRLTELASESVGSHLSCSAQLHLAWEQAPHPDNRVQLSSTERDAFGVPRIELHWKKRAFEHRTMMEAMRILGHDLAHAGIGRVRFDDWVLFEDGYPEGLETAGHHHMGGARMGTDPATSVTDRDCRVHGMRNLHVGGSAVFATAGQCTPTTTITALAVRLGDHLASALSA